MRFVFDIQPSRCFARLPTRARLTGGTPINNPAATTSTQQRKTNKHCLKGNLRHCGGSYTRHASGDLEASAMSPGTWSENL